MNFVKIAAGGNVPSIKPKYEKVLIVLSGWCISSASSFSCSDLYSRLSNAVFAFSSSSVFNL